MCDIDIRAEHGWHKRAQSGAVTVWFKGWLQGFDAEALAARFAHETPSKEAVASLLAQAMGHFAIAASGPGWAFAAVDWVRSIPLAVTQVSGRWTIDDQPERLRRKAGLGVADIDPDAALAIGMAGYTVDTAALYRGIELPTPGELIWIADGEATRHRYTIWRPWRVQEAPSAALEEQCRELTLHLIERLLTAAWRPHAAGAAQRRARLRA